MPFDFFSFVRQHHIPYTTEGKNVARGHFAVKCPFCGSADPSMHMGIGIETGEWACWRDSLHRGRRPERLIVALVGCTWDEASQLAAEYVEHVGLDELQHRISELDRRREKLQPLEAMYYDDGITEIKELGPTRYYHDYLLGRGFHYDHVPDLIRDYQIQCAYRGEWKQRVILPFISGGKVVGWTGRAIGRSELRYVSRPKGEALRQVVYNEDAAAAGGLALFITEGPFDALKIDFYGRQHGVRAVALLTVTATVEKIARLAKYRDRFESLYILLDAEAEDKAIMLADRLAFLEPKVAFLPDGVKDPGDLPKKDVDGLLRKLVQN